MDTAPQLLYEFGSFQLDLNQRILTRDGELVTLAPKVLDTLVLLVQNHGRVLDKDELVHSLWPETFVEDGNLTQNVFLLRKLLGEDRNVANFIQTIPRRGYRFIAPVTVKESTRPKSAPGSGAADYWQDHTPFRSLQAFEPEDSWLFFGRETETTDLLARLNSFPTLIVLGNSGSGKSSLIKAGLVPALRNGRFSWQGTPITSWRIAIFRPSASPFDYLAEVLSHQLAPALSLKEHAEFIAACRQKLPAGDQSLRNAITALVNEGEPQGTRTHVLLVADQFEEIFTLTADRGLRERYINCLLSASRLDSAVPVHLVLILRADFYAHCLDQPELSCCLGTNLYNVPSITGEKLRQTIEKRLELAGACAETGLIDSLLHDVGTETGNLALLEHALGQLWGRCSGPNRVLRSSAYAEIGRLRGALGRHADEVYASFKDDNQKLLAKKIFLQLVHLGEGAEDTRRRVSKSELQILGASQDFEAVLARLVSSRLLSTGRQGEETFVEVSHEALIREWSTLREWLAQNRDDLRLERRLQQAAEDWQLTNRDSSSLLQGARLVQAEEWLSKQNSPQPLLRNFLQESVEHRAETREREMAQQRQLRLEAEARAQAEKELREQQAFSALHERRSAIRLRWLSCALAILLLVAVGVAGVAYHQQLIERSHAFSAQATELLPRDRGQALKLAILSWRTAKTEESQLAVAKAFPQLLATLNHQDEVEQAVFSPDGERLLTADADRSARVWDADGRLLFTLQGHSGRVCAAKFSPNGQYIVTASDDQTARIWSVSDGRLLSTLGHSGPVPVRFDMSTEARATFSNDSQRVVTVGLDRAARVWNTKDGQLAATLEGHDDVVDDAAFSPDGKHIVTASRDHTARMWSSDGRLEVVLSGHAGPVHRVAFFPDGQRVITASWDGSAKIWEASTGHLLATFSHAGAVTNIGLDPNGRYVVTTSQDHTARVWNATNYQLLLTLTHGGAVQQAAVSYDGRFIVTASQDHTARVWNSADGRLLAVLAGHTDAVIDSSFAPDGLRILTASKDHSARLWNTTAAVSENILQGHAGYLMHADFSPDGQRVITVSQDQTARIWTSSDARLLMTLQGRPGGFFEARFSSNGKRIVTAGGDHTAKLWDAGNGRLLATLQGHSGSIWYAEFSPDRRRVVTASADQTAAVWDAVTGRLMFTLRGHTDKVVYAAYSPDGQYIATTSNDNTSRLWYANDGRLKATLQGHTGRVWRAAFSPDGRRLVTASFDHTARVWDTNDGRLLHTLAGHTDLVDAVEFSPDGQEILTASWDYTARLWSSADGRLVAVLAGHTGKLIGAAFAPDGRRLVTASTDRTARVWSTSSHRLLAVLDGHGDQVWQAAFSPDGQHLVTASLDQTARIWQLLTLKELAKFLAQ